MRVEVEKISAKSDLDLAFAIRREVFVVEQKVDPADEYDEFEDLAVHFLAWLDGKAVGAARWRFTSYGLKLERFAVLKSARGNGVGQALVNSVLEDIKSNKGTETKLKYLHAQLEAVSLYSKFGFKKVGGVFEECNILHYQMELI